MDIGRALGRYEVLGRLGAGGMGQVYRARDTRLGRDVAIKLLLDDAAEDPARLARLEREARLMAALNHPNIAGIHSLEEADGVRFLVLELVRGDTLERRLAAGPLPTALAVCQQIAAALEAAHETGVVHRDLKPANVMLTDGGQVKVLDFGIATLRPPPEREGVTGGPGSVDASTVGLVIGTVNYMSPEQASGERVDRRTDIWAFGCVLFETLSGSRPFDRDTVTGTIGAILTRDPDWSRLPPDTPPAVRSLVRRCLRKDPQQRLRDIGDARIELGEALAELGEPAAADAPTRAGEPRPGAPVPPPVVAARWRSGPAPWILIAALLGVVVWQAVSRDSARSPGDRRIVSVQPPAGSVLQSVVVSPDGGRLLLVAADAEGPTHLWVRRLDAAEPQKLDGTTGATYPFWSPDSRSVGFFADGKLKRVAVGGGPVVELCAASNPRGGTWNAEGVIVFASSSRGLSRVSADGGQPAPVTRLNAAAGENSHRFPYFLPDGRHVLYFSRNPVRPALTGVYVVSTASGETKQLLAVNSLAVYAPPGYLLYRRGESLLAQPFDPGTLALRGEAVAVADHVWYDPSFTALASFGVTSGGLLAYRSGGIDKTALVWVGRDGAERGRVGEPANYLNFRLSPNDSQLAVSRTNERTETRNLWIHDLAGGTSRQVTFSSASDFAPAWSPGGDSIAFSSDRAGWFDVYRQPASGGSEATLLLRSPATKLVRDWSSDGRFIAYDALTESDDVDVWALRAAGARAEPFTKGSADQWFGRFSPDGRWIAYTSNELGQYEVFVERFPKAGGRWKISNGGGFQPVWGPTGEEVFYLAPDGKLMAAAVTAAGSAFSASPPRALFQTRVNVATVNPPESLNHYDVSADGARFLISSRDTSTSVPIVLVFDWRAVMTR